MASPVVKQAEVQFVKYYKIENSYREQFINEIIDTAPADELWCATEKIHGANFSIISSINENGELIFARACRSQLLGNAEFHSSLKIVSRYNEQLQKLIHLISNDISLQSILTAGVNNIQIYCEIYGGFYKGAKSVHKDPKKVQIEVQYSPDNEIRIFDILVNRQLLDYRKVIELCKDTDLPYCIVKYEGSLQDLLKLNPVFPTTIPELHGLPSIENNDSEGWVIKPYNARFNVHGHRVIVKLKNPKFTEVVPKSTENKDNIISIDIPAEIIDLALRCVTENRLSNVKSKLVVVNNGKLIMGMIDDIMQEINADYPLSDAIKLSLTNIIRKPVITLVKKDSN